MEGREERENRVREREGKDGGRERVGEEGRERVG